MNGFDYKYYEYFNLNGDNKKSITEEDLNKSLYFSFKNYLGRIDEMEENVKTLKERTRYINNLFSLFSLLIEKICNDKIDFKTFYKIFTKVKESGLMKELLLKFDWKTFYINQNMNDQKFLSLFLIFEEIIDLLKTEKDDLENFSLTFAYGKLEIEEDLLIYPENSLSIILEDSPNNPKNVFSVIVLEDEIEIDEKIEEIESINSRIYKYLYKNNKSLAMNHINKDTGIKYINRLFK